LKILLEQIRVTVQHSANKIPAFTEAAPLVHFIFAAAAEQNAVVFGTFVIADLSTVCLVLL
jgi:hypothetical protein